MPTHHPARLAAGVAATVTVAVPLVMAAPATADPLPYGPDTCIQGYVWREARPGDTVCVTPDIRATVAQQNANRGANKDPDGAYGPESCAQGYLWREAFDGDTVCVTPAFRQQMLDANSAAASRKQANAPKPTPTSSGTKVRFEVTGSDEVYAIWIDPGGLGAPDHTKLPWSKDFTIGPEVNYLSVSPTGRHTPGPGCRIIVDGAVVAEQPVGSGQICIWQR